MSYSESKNNPNLDGGGKDVSKRSTYKFQGPGSEAANPPHNGKKFPPIPKQQAFDSVESAPIIGRKPPQISRAGEAFTESNGSPRLGMYYKRAPTNTSSGSVGNGASVRVQKVKRQNSMGTFGLQRTGSFMGDEDFDLRPVIVDQDKIDAAKKRLLEAKIKKEAEASGKRSWKQRFKWCSTMLVSLTIVLSSSSLLFVVPIIVDPILVGLDAQFSSQPVQCRIVSYENETGPMNCMNPSCREGCTADLYACVFLSVVYTKETQSGRSSNKLFNSSLNTTLPDSNFDLDENTPNLINGTLYVNPSGCGYPPDVNCSIFEKTYGEIGTTFPCYYSSSNASIVVPFYSENEELVNLGFALGIPFGLLFFSAAALFLLLRWDLNRVQDIAQTITDEELEAWRATDLESNETHTLGNYKKNDKHAQTTKINGHGPLHSPLSKSNKSLESSSADPDGMAKKYLANNMMNGIAGGSQP